jgi:hypothetical protein
MCDDRLPQNVDCAQEVHRFPQKIEAQTDRPPISLKIFPIGFRNLSDRFLHDLKFLLHSGWMSLNQCWLKMTIPRVWQGSCIFVSAFPQGDHHIRMRIPHKLPVFLFCRHFSF